MTTLLMWIGSAVVGLVGSAICSGTEIGLYSVNRVRLAVGAKRDDGLAASRRIRRLLEELDRPRRSLATLLILNTVFNNLGVMGITALLTQAGLSEVLIIVVTAAIVTPLLFVFAETLPKEIFRSASDETTARVVPVLAFFRRLLTVVPIIPIIDLFARGLARLLGGDSESDWRDPRQRIAALLKEGAGHGLISIDQAQLLDRAMALRDTAVKDEMIPWRMTRWLHADANQPERIAFARHNNCGRFPVLDKRGRVVGIAERASIGLEPNRRVDAHAQKPLFLDPETNVLQAMAALRRSETRMAIVGRPHAPIGIVTPKDLIEPLVGPLESW